MKLIVGLGNPGKEYAKTRHNMGFMTIDRLCDELNIDVDKEDFKGVYALQLPYSILQLSYFYILLILFWYLCSLLLVGN